VRIDTASTKPLKYLASHNQYTLLK